MRIRDWSSDVCSSDLAVDASIGHADRVAIGIHEVPEQRAGEPALQPGRAAAHLEARLVEECVRDIHRRAFRRDRFRQLEQIGGVGGELQRTAAKAEPKAQAGGQAANKEGATVARTEERRGGKSWVNTGRARGWT